ncbi:NusA N-terminal domain-containing protein [Mycoplasma sp. Ms02]|uniref:NusA N-terminal domain-containing protein n=1 Tax=Mycoplasma sp. Ms02 TaxID=353851 RepID=UPI001C8904B7|nr:NusA N-terminal domain-containing protein [Mycoplasma sp. Ms02]QZE12162.1 transcription termination/antitermination protein NusA [Mycoplasma sp. Ms02]
MSNTEVKKNGTSLETKKNWYIVLLGFAQKNNLLVSELAEILSEETTKVVNKDIDPDAEIEFRVDKENQLVHIYNNAMIVVEDDYEFESEQDLSKITFIRLSEARLYDKEVQVDDLVSAEFDFDLLTEKNKTAIKHGFAYGLKLKDKQKVFVKYEPLIGSKIKARILTRNNNGSYNLIFEDGVTAFLPANKINAKLSMKPGSIIDVYLEAVSEDTKLSQCIVSTDSPSFVEDLMNAEVPEISQGYVEIVKIKRVPGVRSKVVVKSTNLDYSVDPLSAVIGVNGSRIKAINDSLGGEKIDVVLYDEDMVRYIKNAFSPAKILDVVVDEKGKFPKYIAVAKKQDLMIAIGKSGVNINLVKEVTEVNVNVISTEEALENGYEFNQAEMYEKPLFKAKSRAPRKSRTSTYFENIDIDVNEFSADVSRFLEEQLEASEQSAKKAKEASKQVVKKEKVAPLNLDDIFEQTDLNVEQEEDEYDFLNDIDFDKVFDDAEVEVQESEQEVNKEAKPAVSKAEKAYKKAKVELKDFHVDNDLTNYGIDGGLDLSDFDDEWEN